MPEISIIIAAYKVENYIAECLESIVNQTFKNWECIVVDDGSPDSSGRIADEYASRDSRFKVIHRANGGLSAARNTGLAVAKGKYIGFVDSDDWTAPDMYETLHSLIETYGADMAQVSYTKEYVGMSHPKRLVKEVTELTSQELAKETVLSKRVPSYVWNKLFRQEVITSGFPEGQNFEDITALGRWLPSIRKAVISPEICYHYRMRGKSISKIKDCVENRMDYFLACIGRMRMLRERVGEFMTSGQSERYVWKDALRAARIISRMKAPQAEKLSALQRIRSEVLSIYPDPNVSKLGISGYTQVRLMSCMPSLFIRRAELMSCLDIYSKYREDKFFK